MTTNDGRREPGVRHRYRTIELGNTDIHVRTLRDQQQFSDPDHTAERLGVSSATWPLFGVVWQSAEILARLMLEFDIADKKILEVGCGIALPSLLLNSRLADITATDYHPEAKAYLAWNVGLNNHRAIPFVRTGWEEENTELGHYDLIIGSDLLYQPDHPELLARFLCKHAREHCQVIIVDPARGNTSKFSQQLIGAGFLQSDIDTRPFILDDVPYKGQIRNYLR